MRVLSPFHVTDGRDDAPDPALMRRVSAAGRVEKPKLATMVADLIADSILVEGMQPGARLPPEREMLGQVGVGRGTLREALRLLEAQGLIAIRTGPHGGPVVQRPDAGRLTRMLLLLLVTSGATLRHVYEAREALDPTAARLAATHATDEQVSALRGVLEDLRERVDDEAEFLRANSRLHRIIAESSANPVVHAFSVSMLEIIDGHGVGIRYSVAVRRSVIEAHTGLVDAIEARDADLAAERSLTHVRASSDYVAKRFPAAVKQPIRPMPDLHQRS